MWDPPAISTDVAGYVVDYGTASGSYSQGINVGNTTSYTLGNLPDGQVCYFAVAAYNSSGALSDYSNEVSKTTEMPQYSLAIQKTGTGTGVVSGGGINCGSTCSALYKSGTATSLLATVGTGSAFAGWSGGGCSGTGICATTINAATTVTATFNANIVSYGITATVSGTGGVISPAGISTVNSGGSKTFTITPNTGYRVADVTVDGQSVGAIAGYTFSNVVANHTITATFATNIVTYVITATVSGAGGSISPSGSSSVSQGGSKTFTIKPRQDIALPVSRWMANRSAPLPAIPSET